MLARMRRWIGFIIIPLTALPFLTAAGLAVRSIWWVDIFGLSHASFSTSGAVRRCDSLQLYGLVSEAGRFTFRCLADTGPDINGQTIFTGGWKALHGGYRFKGGWESMLPSQEKQSKDRLNGTVSEIDWLGLQAYTTFSKNESKKGVSTCRNATLAFPFWWSLPLLSLPPLLTLILYRRAARRRLVREGRCVGCGYDLRGSPGRCPECGRGAEAVSRTSPP